MAAPELVYVQLLAPQGRYLTIQVDRGTAERQVAEGTLVKVDDGTYREVPLSEQGSRSTKKSRAKKPKDDG